MSEHWELWACPRCGGLDGSHYEDCPHQADPQRVEVVPKAEADRLRAERDTALKEVVRMISRLALYREALAKIATEGYDLNDAPDLARAALEGSEDGG